jgi:hypothetical protein
MAFTGLLALIDDVAVVLDDIAVLVKLSAKKTSGIVTDDLVVTAEQVASITTKREIPIIMDVAKGSLVNKAILVPAALLINFFLPFLITPLLLLGAAYLCYEGAEKIIHSFAHHDEQKLEEPEELNLDAINKVEDHMEENLLKQQKDKINQAIRTDFILSAEIIIIALNVVAQASLSVQIATLVAIGLLMTVVVYGAVIALVKIDDLGFFLIKKAKDVGSMLHKLGRGLVVASTKMMGLLSIIGTAAMLLVGGEIVLHKVQAVEELLHGILHWHPEIYIVGNVISAVWPKIVNMLVGLVYGLGVIAIMLPSVKLFEKMKGKNA